MRGEFPSQEQTTWSGNSRSSSVCLLARIEWNNRGQPETPARRKSRVISVRRFEFFQPLAVLAAAHSPILLPVDVTPTKRERFRGCPKPSRATQSQAHLPDRIGLLHQLVDHFPGYERVDLHRAPLGLYLKEWVRFDDLPIDRIVHELPRKLDPFVDRRRGHPSGFELLVKILREIKNLRQSGQAVREFS